MRKEVEARRVDKQSAIHRVAWTSREAAQSGSLPTARSAADWMVVGCWTAPLRGLSNLRATVLHEGMSVGIPPIN